MQHVSGAENIVADCLSRPSDNPSPVRAVQLDIYDLPHISSLQTPDFVQQMVDTYKKGTQTVAISNQTLLSDNSVVPRPILPQQCRYPIFQQFHNLSHPDWKVTFRIITARFTWPSASKDIKKRCQTCLPCQQHKVTRHTKPAVEQINDGLSRFTHVHMDLVGPLPQLDQSPHRYLVTFIDRNTNWIEAESLADITAKTVCNAFLKTWFSRFGVPLYVTTDRGAQFESELFSHLSKALGFCRLRTTAYHPQANGKIERVHRTLKSALMSSKHDWINALPAVLFGLRIKPDSHYISPLSATTGLEVLLPNCLPDPSKPLNNSFVQSLRQHLDLLALTNSSSRSQRPLFPRPSRIAHTFGCAWTESDNHWKHPTLDHTKFSPTPKDSRRCRSTTTEQPLQSASNVSKFARCLSLTRLSQQTN